MEKNSIESVLCTIFFIEKNEIILKAPKERHYLSNFNL